MSNSIDNLIKLIEKNERKVSTLLGVVVVVALCGTSYFLLLDGKIHFDSSPSVEVEVLEKAATNEADTVIHVVKTGEGLSSLALEYYGDKELWKKIAEVNNILNPDLIEIGQELVIPDVETSGLDNISNETNNSLTTTPETYVVKKGDYLARIAIQVYGNSDRWIDILNANRDKISNPEILEAGVELVLPR